MPLPSGLSPRDLVAIVDADDQALAWIKDLAKDPSSPSNTIPERQLTTALIGKNEVFIIYGDQHPSYKAGSDNIASFNIWFEINEFGTSYDATGCRPIPIPVSKLLCVPIYVC